MLYQQEAESIDCNVHLLIHLKLKIFANLLITRYPDAHMLPEYEGESEGHKSRFR